MSLNSMTNVAVHRREDYPPQGDAPRSVDQMASAASSATTPGTNITNALAQIVTYIPTEILTLYVSVKAALRQPDAINVTAEWITFAGFLLATPVIVWLLFAAKVKSDGKSTPRAYAQMPVWEMIAGMIAFSVWAFALPESPFETLGWYSAALGGVAVLLVSTFLGLIAPVVQGTLKA